MHRLVVCATFYLYLGNNFEKMHHSCKRKATTKEYNSISTKEKFLNSDLC